MSRKAAQSDCVDKVTKCGRCKDGDNSFYGPPCEKSGDGEMMSASSSAAASSPSSVSPTRRKKAANRHGVGVGGKSNEEDNNNDSMRTPSKRRGATRWTSFQ